MPNKINARYMKVKRIMDIAIAGTAIVLLFPLYVVLAIAVFIDLGNPVIFKQVRPGYMGKAFTIYKYRSMKNSVDEEGFLKDDKHRLTQLGKILRSTSLDELPEFINVIKGDMSLVGPRPLRMEYIPLYSQKQQRRNEIRPGITGLAQVSGRNLLSWHQRFELDVFYVDNISFMLDLKILLLTVKKVLAREGVNEHGNTTMSKFTGKN